MSEEFAEIRDRLTKLETRSEDWWNAHDKRSEDNWRGLNKMMEEVKEFIKTSGERKDKCMGEAKNYANFVVGLAVGIPVCIVAIVTVIAELHKIFGK